MIRVFNAGDTVFLSNGDKVIRPTKAIVNKEDNGDFYLDLETDLSYVDWIVPGKILVADTPQGEQAFRVRSVEKTRTKVFAKVPHVFFDCENLVIEDSFVVDKNCNDALDHLNQATDTASPFQTISDVETVNSYRCVRKSLYEAVQTVVERWGGHLVRDNFEIGIRAEIGQDIGAVIRYRKNLKAISCAEDWNDVATKLLPVGKDGFLLPEIYVLAARQYEIPFTKTVSFEQEIDAADYVDDAAYQAALADDLRRQAQDYLQQHDIPSVNYTLTADLKQVTDIGDTVEVIDERLGINILTNVISYKYDCIAKRYVELEFGNFKKKLSGLLNNVTAKAEEIATEKTHQVQVVLGEELKAATDKIWDALGNSYVIYEGDRILVVDALPADQAQHVMMINSGGIAFSANGINGTFNSAWTIDGTMDMQQIHVVNLTADLIKGGTLKLGAAENQSGQLEIYDEANNLVGVMDKNGLKMYGQDGSYVLMNNEVGFAGYDRHDNKIYWVSQDEFHMKKSVVEEEITLCNQLRFIPIRIEQGGAVVNEGIGLVSYLMEGQGNG